VGYDDYWGASYWAGSYWADSYWAEYGTAAPPPTEPEKGVMWKVPIPEPPIPLEFIDMLKQYLEAKKEWLTV